MAIATVKLPARIGNGRNHAGNGLSQSALPLEFGLGAATVIDFHSNLLSRRIPPYDAQCETKSATQRDSTVNSLIQKVSLNLRNILNNLLEIVSQVYFPAIEILIDLRKDP